MVASGEPVFAADGSTPFCRLLDSSGQTLTSAGTTVFEWETVEVDSHGMFDPGQPTRLTPDRAGWYAARFEFFVPSRSGGYSLLEAVLRRNGSDLIAPLSRRSENGSSGSKSMPLATEVELDGAGDYVEFLAIQTNSGAASVAAPASGSFASYASLRWIRPSA